MQNKLAISIVDKNTKKALLSKEEGIRVRILLG